MGDDRRQTFLGVLFTILAAVGLSIFIPKGVANHPKAPESAGVSTPPSAGYSAVDDAAERSGDERILDPLVKFLELDHNLQSAPPTAPQAPGSPLRLKLEIGGGQPQDAPAEPRPGILKNLCDALEASDPGKAWALQFMIVTVPDPVDSAQGEQIDLLLETFQNAMRLDQLVLDRYYLPWQSYREAAKKAAGAAKAGPERTYIREPGLLLFRETDETRLATNAKHDRPRLLLVFLVGETPVFGIHKEAFVRSVKLIRGLGASRQDVTIPVLAPYFSGSVGSLIQAIESDPPGLEAKPAAGDPEFDIISGTATSIDEGRFDRLQHEQKRVKFRATAIPEKYIQNELERFTHALRTAPRVCTNR